MIDFDNAPGVPFDRLKDLPKECGVYIVYSGDDIVYIGESQNIRQRWSAHHRKAAVSRLSDVVIRWFPMSKDEALAVERELIQRFTPPLNGPLGEPREYDPNAIQYQNVRLYLDTYNMLTELVEDEGVGSNVAMVHTLVLKAHRQMKRRKKREQKEGRTDDAE